MRIPPWILKTLLATSLFAGGRVLAALDLWPRNGTVELGSTRQFGAYVPLSPSTVTWAVNGVVGGNAALGTISASGLYTPPPTAPEPSTLTVTVRSTAFPGESASTALTVTRKYPWLWGASPSSIPAGAYDVALNGSNFAPDAVVLANGVPVTTVFKSSTQLRAQGVAGLNPLKLSVLLPGPGAVTGNVVNVTVTVPSVVVAVSPSSASVPVSGLQAFTASVTGAANTAVTWSVNGVAGGSASVGLISPSGVYTAPPMPPSPATVTVRATSVAAPTAFAQATVTVTQPTPPPVAVSWAEGARFLDQSSFGANSASLARVTALGIEPYLDEQLAMAWTPVPGTVATDVGALRRWQLHHYTAAPDQLRQRVAYSLGQILVASTGKLVNANEIVPWIDLLNREAFGNYRDLLRDLTRCPSMGKYLDLANSMKAGAGSGANENYPRELLQLFTIGLWELNPDGSRKLTAGGDPIPAYTQQTVSELARALTGWTYATAPGATPQNNNWEYFGAPMEPRQQNHDTGTKTFLGTTIPAGQTVEQDLDSVLDVLTSHPNTAPFVSTRLIRSLVTSNPSGAYVQRVAQVFRDNGSGVRGDLKAVVRAILLDVEARPATTAPLFGRLKEPILHVTTLVRALDGQIKPGQQITYLFDNLGQSVLNPPSVFSWFSPLFRIPKTTNAGPEFQIYSPTEATLRGNLVNYIVTGQGAGDFAIDLTPYQAFGNDMPGLVEVANQRLLKGRMSPAMKQVLIDAASPGYDARTRIETVLYLTALTAQFSVQH